MKFQLPILIAIVWLFVMILIAVNRGHGPDEATHAMVGKFFKDSFLAWLQNPTLSYEKIYNYATAYLVHYPKLSLHYTPLPQMMFAVAFLFFGTSVLTARIVIALLSLVFLVVVYGFTYKLTKNQLPSLIAAVLMMSSPLIISSSVAAMQEIPLILFFTLAMFFYYKISLGEADLKYKIFFVLAVAMCVLSKWQGIVILPTLLMLIIVEKNSKVRKELFVGLLCAGILLAPYYYLQWKTGLLLMPLSLNAPAEPGDPLWYTADGWLYYLKIFTLNQMPMVGAVLVLLTAYYIKKKILGWKMFLVWIVVVYVALTFLTNKDSRYDISIMPAFVIPSAVMLWKFMETKRLRKITFVVMVLLVVQFAFGVYVTVVVDKSLSGADVAAKYVVSKTKGNILLQHFYGVGTPFTFEIARTEKFSGVVLRNCLIESYNGSYEQMMKEYGVEYVIAKPFSELYKTTNYIYGTEYVYMGEAKKLNDFYNYMAGSEKFAKELEIDGIVVFRYKDFTAASKVCNYICSTNSVMCTNFLNPQDALS